MEFLEKISGVIPGANPSEVCKRIYWTIAGRVVGFPENFAKNVVEFIEQFLEELWWNS